MEFLPDIDLTAIVQLIGYPGIFAIIFTETGLPIGFFLPGVSLLFASGVAAAFGFLNIWVLVPLVIVAAILGDNVGYLFGTKVGVRLFTRPDSRFFKQAYVDQTRIYFEKYGTQTVLLARFVPIVRTFTPILAGVGAMNYRVFFFYNVIGAFLWAGGITLAGYLVGDIFPQAQEYITPIILVLIAITCIPLIPYVWKRKPIRRISKCPRVAIFDIDDTLTESFKPPSPHIVEKLSKLLDHIPVAIMSAAGFQRIEKEFLPMLSKSPHAARLFVFPNSTAEGYVFQNGAWMRAYDNELTEEERARIKRAIEESVTETQVLSDVTPTGIQVVDRGAQVAFAALGLEAPDEDKKSWDVDKTKRQKLQRALRRRLPDFEVLIGGRTTIDITRKGINKAYGVRWLSKRLEMKPREFAYIGDALYRGGNDAVVIPTGIKTYSTRGPEETERLIDELIESCAVLDQPSANTGAAKNT